MESKGRLVNITRDYLSGKLNVTFQIETEPIEELNNLATLDELDITAKKHRRKRSLDANAYFHVLVGKLADKLLISKTRCKNILIGRYGQQELLEDGTPVVLKTNLGVDCMLEQEFLHCHPCGCKQENGIEVVFYKVFRGSHTYDTKEMSILIDGTVQEAKEQGIETIPPAELERMVGAWQRD
jgi:hypothetical protein